MYILNPMAASWRRRAPPAHSVEIVQVVQGAVSSASILFVVFIAIAEEEEGHGESEAESALPPSA